MKSAFICGVRSTRGAIHLQRPGDAGAQQGVVIGAGPQRQNLSQQSDAKIRVFDISLRDRASVGNGQGSRTSASVMYSQLKLLGMRRQAGVMRGQIEQRDLLAVARGHMDRRRQIFRDRIGELHFAFHTMSDSRRAVKTLVTEPISNTVSPSGTRGSLSSKWP